MYVRCVRPSITFSLSRSLSPSIQPFSATACGPRLRGEKGVTLVRHMIQNTEKTRRSLVLFGAFGADNGSDPLRSEYSEHRRTQRLSVGSWGGSSDTHSHSRSRSPTLSHSLSPTLTHSLALTLTHSHFLTLNHSLSNSGGLTKILQTM